MDRSSKPKRNVAVTRERLVDGVTQADRRVRGVARQHPFLAFGGALLFGYVAGRIARS